MKVRTRHRAMMKPAAGANELSPSRIRERQEWPGGQRAMVVVLGDYREERERQNRKHPDTDQFPDGTGHPIWLERAGDARQACDEAAAAGECTWLYVMREEVYEAFAESDQAKLREELVQVMAVAGRWIEAIDARP